MRQGSEIRTTVIGTVVGGLILAAVLWAIGALGSVAAFVWRILKAVAAVMLGRVEIPVWLLVLTIGILIWVLVRGFLLWKGSRVKRISDVSELPDLDRTLLIGVRLGDGDRVDLAALAKFGEVTRLEVEAAMDQLEESGLVQPHYNAFSGTSWTLTTEGRDLLPDLQAVIAARGS